jgi:hypothetical protein
VCSTVSCSSVQYNALLSVTRLVQDAYHLHLPCSEIAGYVAASRSCYADCGVHAVLHVTHSPDCPGPGHEAFESSGLSAASAACVRDYVLPSLPYTVVLSTLLHCSTLYYVALPKTV